MIIILCFNYRITEVTEPQNVKQDFCEYTIESQFQLPIQVGFEIVSLDHYDEQDMIPRLQNINWENIDEKGHVQQLIDLKPLMNSSDVMEESKTFQNNTEVLHSTDISNEVSFKNPLCIQITEQNSVDINTSKPGPLRNRIGRTPKDEIPLYLQPEPENKEEKRKWRHAITAYEHRTSKKTTLIDNAKMIENLTKEMNQLKNQLQIVTAERDTYKNTLDNLMRRI